MKVGTDGTLLGAWGQLPETLPPNGHRRILDVGTGTGLVALMMAQRYADARVVGIDIDEEAVEQASANVGESPFAHRVTIQKADIRDWKSQEYEAIVCNPPFFVNALQCPDAQRSMARHAVTLDYATLARCARSLLSDEGELSVVVPTECRSEMESEACIQGFFKVRQCAVKTTPYKSPKRFLLAFARHSRSLEDETIVIGDEKYSLLTKEFYL